MSRSLGAAGEALIKSFESLRLNAYLDGGGIPTIGWGHTGPEVALGLIWTEAQCENVFQNDVGHAVAAVDQEAPLSITQNQFDALVSFGYNVGVTAEANSTLMVLVKSGDMGGAAAQFLRWDHVNGIPSAGLLRRRQAEQALFLAS